MGILKKIFSILAIVIFIYGLWFIFHKAFIWALLAILGAIVFVIWLVKGNWGL